MQVLKRWLFVPVLLLIGVLYMAGLSLMGREEPVLPHEDIAAEEVVEEASVSQEDKLNINTATKEELMTLNGIGEAIAQRIIDKRDGLGKFKTVEQLLEVKGIGENKLEKLKEKITVE